MRRIVLCLIALASPLFAQSLRKRAPQHKPATGVIEGDVFVLTKAGDIKKGAANRVYLLPVPVVIDSEFASFCRAKTARYDSLFKALDDLTDTMTNKELKRLTLRDERARLSRMADAYTVRMYELLSSRAINDSPTGLAAHYSLTGITAGKYVVFAKMPLGGDILNWFVPVALKDGSHVKLDLDNSNLTALEFDCDKPLPFVSQ
jgi:hypothetical protein